MNNTAFHGAITLLLLVVHVVTGSIAAVSGFVALFAVKGLTVHRRSGRIFVYSMVVMALLGAVLSVVRGSLPAGNIPVGLLTAYLVVSGLTTVRPASSSAVDWALMIGAVVSGVTLCAFGVAASSRPDGKLYDLPPTPYFAFGAVALLAALGDVAIPVMLALLMMLYWLWKIRLRKSFHGIFLNTAR